MKKSASHLYCIIAAVLVLCAAAGADNLGLVMPQHTNSCLFLSATGGTLMYGSAHSLPGSPDNFAYRYLSGVGLGHQAAYSGTVIGNSNLLTLQNVLNRIENLQPLGIKFITNGTNEQGWSLGQDIAGQDWSFDLNTWIENRIYSASNEQTVESALFYGDQRIITFAYSDVYMILNYQTGELVGYSDACTYTKAAALAGDALAVADAFIADFDRAGGMARLIYDSIDPIVYQTGTAVINNSPAALPYALYSWVGRIQTLNNVQMCAAIPVGDLNFDCCVNFQDLVIMAQNWAVCNWQDWVD